MGIKVWYMNHSKKSTKVKGTLWIAALASLAPLALMLGPVEVLAATTQNTTLNSKIVVDCPPTSTLASSATLPSTARYNQKSMEKDFDKWNTKKKALHQGTEHPFFHEREVWWCFLGANIGFEQDGGEDFVRPVLVFKKFNNEVFWALPLSTKIKKGQFYSPVDLVDGIPRVAILSQLRLVDAKRLRDKVETLGEQQYTTIRKAVVHLVTYDRPPNLSGPTKGETEAEAV